MRAWVVEKPGSLELREVPVPRTAPGEILVRVSVCGVCRTDLHVVDGEIPLPRLPVVPGHQAVGRVVGPSRRFREGERVGIAWLRRTCGACEDCRRGDENLCEAATFNGFHADGGFAEFAAVPEDFAYRLPEGLDDAHVAPLLCAGIVGFRALRRSGMLPGERIGLYGFGSSAHVSLQVARFLGCRVAVVTRGETHRELARSMGAEWVGGPGERPPFALDRAVIFAPAGEIVPEALSAVRRGGVVASAAIHMSEIPALDYDRLIFGERTLTSTTASTRRDGEDLLALAARGAVVPHVVDYRFEEATEALADIRADRVRGSAVLTIGP